MYSRDFFIKQFSALDTEDLLAKLVLQELSENARDAVIDLLVARGLPTDQIDRLSKDAHKALLRQSKGTKFCDFCSDSAKTNPVFDEGQRFCSARCLEAARLSEVAVDVTKSEIELMAQAMSNDACPICKNRDSPVEVRYCHTVMSFIFLTEYRKKGRLCCLSCGRFRNKVAFIKTLFLGWWGFPWGISMTPIYLIANAGEMFEHRKKAYPSEALLREAKYVLALSALTQSPTRVCQTNCVTEFITARPAARALRRTSLESSAVPVSSDESTSSSLTLPGSP